MSTITTTKSPADGPMLTAMDRADCCGVQAKVEVARVTGDGRIGNLLFCGHHINKHADALDDAGYIVIVNDLAAS